VTNTIIVIGAGQAGGWAAKTLRSEGFAGRIVFIGDEQHPAYERPPLSKAVLAGETAPETTYLLKPEAFEELGLEWRRGERAAAIDRDAKRVVLGHGELIGYDKLILCTGGRARWPSVAGADLPGVFALRTIEDSVAIGHALDEAKRLVVVGGGWIGLEVAATARKKRVAVTVVEARPRLCERTVPSQVSEYLLASIGKTTPKSFSAVVSSGLRAIRAEPSPSSSTTAAHWRRTWRWSAWASLRMTSLRVQRGSRARTVCSSMSSAGLRTRTSSLPATSRSHRIVGSASAYGSSRGRTGRIKRSSRRRSRWGATRATTRCPGSGRISTT
jgi:pyridine nucleotide-disulfide oxidoreductase